MNLNITVIDLVLFSSGMLGGIFLIIYVGFYHTTDTSNFIQSLAEENTTEIYNLAVNLTNECYDEPSALFPPELCAADSVNKWVHDNIQYMNIPLTDFSGEFASETLKRGSGVCRHQASLSCSLLKSVNINCRFNSNTIVRNNYLTGHAWFEVDVPRKDRVIKCDPTVGGSCMYMKTDTYLNEVGKLPLVG